MMKEDIDREIEKMKMRKVELVSKLNLINNFDEKEELQNEIEIIQKQIDVLEKFKK